MIMMFFQYLSATVAAICFNLLYAIITFYIKPLKQRTNKQTNKQTPWPLVRERTIPTDRQPLVGEF
jgi:hypothetical protein